MLYILNLNLAKQRNCDFDVPFSIDRNAIFRKFVLTLLVLHNSDMIFLVLDVLVVGCE